MDLQIIVDLFQRLNESQLILLAVLKVLTSLVVAVQTGTFKADMFGEMFKDDFLKLAVVIGLILLTPSAVFVAPIVVGYVGYLGMRVIANLGLIFPMLGQKLPEGVAKTAAPNGQPE